MTDRELAYEILYDIHINNVLCHKALKKHLDACDQSKLQINKPFVSHIVNGVTKRYHTLCIAEGIQAGRPLSKIKPALRIIMAMGLYQGYFMAVPVSAACNESVKLAKKHGLSGLSGFVNGVLRGFFRQYETFEDFLDKSAKGRDEIKQLELRYSCPEWIIKCFIAQLGLEKTIEALKASLEESRLTVYKVKHDLPDEELEKSFERDGADFKKLSVVDDAYELKLHGSVAGLEAFKRGYILVQDVSSMLASQIIPIQSSQRVLDMCAAPGGKTVHLASLIKNNGGQIEARDISEAKIKLIKENSSRIGLDNVTAMVADAAVYRPADDNKFDVVVADLPCSGLGVIGRKPDIKYKTRPEDIQELASLQKKILDNAMRYVKPNGYLAYSTCTVTSEENNTNADYILNNGCFELIDITNSLDKTMQNYLQSYGYMQIFPDSMHDGFFIALFRKIR